MSKVTVMPREKAIAVYVVATKDANDARKAVLAWAIRGKPATAAELQAAGAAKGTAASEASTLLGISAMCKAWTPAEREAQLPVLFGLAAMPFGAYGAIIRDAIAGKLDSARADVLTGKGETLKLVPKLKPVSVQTVIDRKAARTEAAKAEKAEPAGKAEPSVEQTLSPKVRLVALMNDLQSLSAELQFSDVTKGKTLLEKIGVSLVSLEAITKP